ncbi:MAG TPA: hypothetical protein VEK11_24345 [Thermoanaerobaculia bacterium]|nr:hypothetical protein [Thermoanaerobaculia bacterium]
MFVNLRHSLLFATLLLAITLAVPALAQEEEGPPEADLVVFKSGPIEADPGENVTYTVELTNGGQIDAVDVTLSDPLPEGMTFVSATQNSGPSFSCTAPNTGDPGTITCTRALLAVGESATFTFVATIPADAEPGTVFVNIATATTTTADSTDENNSGVAGTTTPPPPTADLTVEKSGPPASGSDADVTYTITVLNGGPDTATDVTVTDTLPGTMTFVSLSQSPEVLSCTTPAVGAGGTITCTAATMAAGESVTLTLVGHIPDQTPPGQPFDNTATVTTNSLDPNEENNVSTTSLTTSNADLSVVKSNPGSGTAGQPLTYTITVANAGPDPASSVSLTDVLPPNTTFVSFTQNNGPLGACAAPPAGMNGTVVCTWETFPIASAQFTLTLRPGNTASVTNTATVTTSSFDHDEANNESSVTSAITPVADLAVTKDGPATVTAGTNATYTVSLSNLGPSDATSVSLTDAAPANTTFVSATQNSGPSFSCTTGATTTCTIVSFAAGSTATFTFVFAVAPNASGTIDNTASVTSATDPNGGNDSDTASSTVVTSADLSVAKAGPGAATAGSEVTFTINVANGGPSDAANVALDDTLPASMTLVSFTQNSGPAFACTTDGTIHCTLATFAAGSTAAFTLVATVAPGTTGTISNTATVSAATADPVSSNNTSTVNVIVGANADLRIAKSGPATATSGSEISYSIVVRNDGPSSAADVVLTDVVPAHTTFVSAIQNSGPLFTCTTPAGGATGTISCTHPLLPPAVATFTFTFRVDADAFEPISNTASIASSTPDPTPGNASGAAATGVVPGATDLRITKVANGTTLNAGGPAMFTIDVINDGPATALNTTVTDVLPAGTTFVSATSTQGTCTGTATVTCTVGTLAPGGTATITLIVTLPPTPALIANTATVSATNAESNPANNTSTAEIMLAPGATGIPTLSPWMLAALALGIAMIALLRS